MALAAAQVLALALVWGAGAPAQARPDGATVSSTVVVVAEEGTSRADATQITAGVRAGLRAISDVEYIDAVDLLSAEDTPRELLDALDEIEALKADLRRGSAPGAGKRAEALYAILGKYAALTKRTALIDGLMLVALAACDDRNDEACDGGFRRVVAIREDMVYDTASYPKRHLDRFTKVQSEFLERGARGTLEIATEPLGAEVFVDGRSHGPSPAVVPGLLAGEHFVTAKAVGFAKALEVARVRGNQAAAVSVELPTNERALLLENDLPRVGKEVGEPRAGKAISGLAAYLFAQQVVIVAARRRAAGELEALFYLYDLRTKFLLNSVQANVPADGDLSKAAERATRDLYEGVDREGAVDAPEDPQAKSAPAFYERWWFWAAVGVVAVSGGVAIGVAASSGGEGGGAPSGWTRVGISIE